ncbi:transposase [Ferrimicrobium acidiphilum]|uniref:transposase n=1 Tax=Ferrimicrobium acidiphilum TaxID=121039 RepID=UPI003C6CD7A7
MTEGEDQDLFYGLFCTITDPEIAPAHELATLHSKRWEIESVFGALKTHQQEARRVLRSQYRPGDLRDASAPLWDQVTHVSHIGIFTKGPGGALICWFSPGCVHQCYDQSGFCPSGRAVSIQLRKLSNPWPGSPKTTLQPPCDSKANESLSHQVFHPQ